MTKTTVKPCRTLLFVPGSRPELFEKAIDTAADVVCIDLEDAVPLSQKSQALRTVSDYFANCRTTRCSQAVRINPLGTTEAKNEIEALESCIEHIDFLMLPKVESEADTTFFKQRLAGRGCRLILLIETPKGLLNLQNILNDCDDVAAVMLGGADLSAATRSNMSWDALLFARSLLITAAAIHDIRCIDTPFLDVRNETGLREECHQARAIGFAGKAAIHPNQVESINSIMTPTEEEVSWAEKILVAEKASNGGAVLVDGRLVDAPVVQNAQSVLALAEQIRKFNK